MCKWDDKYVLTEDVQSGSHWKINTVLTQNITTTHTAVHVREQSCYDISYTCGILAEDETELRTEKLSGYYGQHVICGY